MSPRPLLASALLTLLACAPSELVSEGALPLVGPRLVIALVHAGGGNVGAIFDRDFVVLVNRGDEPASMAGHSLQYANATAVVSLGANDASRVELPAVVIEPGGAWLVGGAFGGGVGVGVGVVDTEDATPIAFATSGGRLALVRDAMPLGCNGGSIACGEAELARVVDRVAWGNAPFAEGAAMRAPGNDEVLSRGDGGCVDTERNEEDFARVGAFLRRSGDALRPCFEGGADGGVRDGGVGGDGGDGGSLPGVSLSIRELQGSTYVSPYEGSLVRDVRGVVTFVSDGRFAIEEEGDAFDSSGVFVTTRGATVDVGTLVSIDGVVRERASRCASCADASMRELRVTTIEASSVMVLGRASLPAPVSMDESFPDAIGPYSEADREAATTMNAEGDALDRLERLEGRRVRFERSVVVGPTRARAAGRRALAIAVPARVQMDALRGVQDPGPGRHGGAFVVVDTPSLSLPFLEVGDRFEGELIGVVDTEDSRPVIRLIRFAEARRSEPSSRSVNVVALAEDEWSLASFNVHGLAATDSALRYSELARTIVTDLGAPDVLVLQEVADDSGSRDDGVVSAADTLRRLVDSVRIAGGPSYEFASVDPRDGSDGGAPGANIRSVVLYRGDRGFSSARREGDADSPTFGARASASIITPNPARIGALADAFVDSRKPLIVELTREGESIVVIAVHLRSHLGDEPRLGRMQPPSRPSEIGRLEQTLAIAELVDSMLEVDPRRAIVVAGDFNDGADSSAMLPLVERGIAPARADDALDVGTYIYDGIATSFDRAHLSPALAERLVTSRPVHLGATRANGVSDHDPMLVVFGPSKEEGRGTSCSLLLRPHPFGLRTLELLLIALAYFIRRSRRYP